MKNLAKGLIALVVMIMIALISFSDSEAALPEHCYVQDVNLVGVIPGSGFGPDTYVYQVVYWDSQLDDTNTEECGNEYYMDSGYGES